MNKILFIDTNTTSNDYLAYKYSKLGFLTFKATSGEEGFSAAYREQPDIIVLDPVFTDISVGELLRRIRKNPRTATCKLIALSSLQDPEKIQQAINQKFDRFLTKGTDVLDALTNAITELIIELDNDSGNFPARATEYVPVHSKNCKTIVVMSAKGGTGTSTICANLAATFSSLLRSAKIAVVDLVLPIGSIAPIVGLENGFNIVEASRLSSAELAPSNMENRLPTVSKWGFDLLSGAATPEDGELINISNIPVVLESIRRDYDFMFVDIGKSLSRITNPIVINSDQTVLILSLDQATVTVTKIMLDFLENKGLHNERVYPLINRAVGLEGLTKREVDAIIGNEISGNIPHVHGEFAMANNAHLPIAQKFPDNIVGVALREVSKKLLKRMEIPLPKR